MLTKEDGSFLLKLARSTVENFVKNHKTDKPLKYPESLQEQRGIFCTIYKMPEKNLRGCIGLPYPVMPLIEAVIQSAVSACSDDPRFRPLREAELDKIKIELSVLTEPKLIEAPDFVNKIKIGEDGLIIQHGPYSGLLLPQVATEYGWGVEEFLDNLCEKAGMHAGMWKEKGIMLYKFQAQIFSE